MISNSLRLCAMGAAAMVEPVSGPTKVEKCGEGCIDVWVGQIGDNYWQAACAFFNINVV